jgi:hypothetical protein
MREYLRQAKALVDDGALSFVAGTRQRVEMMVPDTYIKNLILSVRGTLTISAVSVPGLPHLDGPSNLIRQIELKIDGDQVKLGQGPFFLRLAQLYNKTLGVNSGILTGAAGVYQFHCIIPIMFAMPDSVSPLDSAEDGGSIEKGIELAITWGQTSDLIVGNTSTLAIAATAQVYLDDTEKTFQRKKIFRFRQYETSDQNIVTAGNTRIIVPPPNAGSLVRTILMRATDGANLSDAVIDTLNALKINGSKEVPLSSLEDDFLQALALYNDGAQYMPDGYIPIELAERGLIATTALGASGRNIKTLDLFLGTTVGAGATSIDTHVAVLEPRGEFVADAAA